MKRFYCLLLIGWLSLALIGQAASIPAAQLNAEQQQWLAQHKELRMGLVLQAAASVRISARPWLRQRRS